MNPRTLLKRLLLFWIFTAASAAAAGNTWKVGIVPQFPPEQIFAAWRPVLDALEAGTGEQFELLTFESIPDFETAFIRGELDIAYMNPYHVIMANRAQGYLPVVRDGKQRLSGVLVVRKDSGYTRLQQLNGETLAFPSPNAFGASLYMRALLKEQEHVEIVPLYVDTHSNVYRHVVTGRAAAGGGVRRTLEREPEGLRQQLRVLYETPAAYPHPIVVHPRVPAALRDGIQRRLLTLNEEASTAGLLEQVQIPSPAVATLDDYKPLESLGLERFVENPQ